MGNPTYFVILLAFLVLAIVLQKSQHLTIFSSSQHALLYTITTFLIGLVWDYFSVSNHIWEFPVEGTLGFRIGVLPIEEFGFFLIVPYLGIVLHTFFEKITQQN